MLFKKIMVPLDGSVLSEQALEPALALAQAHRGEILLLSAFSPQEPVDAAFWGLEIAPVPADVAPLRERLHNYLDHLRQSRAGLGVPLQTLALEGKAADCIVETAVTYQTDLIVMSTHGRSGASRLFLSSVTESVLQRAPCPVLAVRGQPTFRRVLIIVNQTMLSEQALDPGFAVAGCFGAQVHLLMISPDGPIGPEAASEWDEATGRQRGEEAFRHEEAYLEDLGDWYQMTQPVVTAVRGGKQENAIPAYAKAHEVDLIVLAIYRHSGLRRWLFGNLSEQILRHAPCSVMMIPPPTQEY